MNNRCMHFYDKDEQLLSYVYYDNQKHATDYSYCIETTTTRI